MKNSNPYSRFCQDEMILRDYLALDRTILANERTFLAYIRTALALIISGASAIKLLGTFWIVVTGWSLIAIGIATLLIGIFRYIKMDRRINSINTTYEKQQE